MPEYIEREAAVRMAVESATEIFDCHTTLPLLKVANKIRAIPSVDVVEVVRCKDCEDYNGHRYCEYHAVTVLDDDFCSYGHRKEGAEE